MVILFYISNHNELLLLHVCNTYVIHRWIHLVSKYFPELSLKIQCKAAIELNSKALPHFRLWLVSL